MAGAAHITRQDFLDAAMIFGRAGETFTARAFTAFLQVQAHNLHEEEVDEILAEFADGGRIRRIGPGVYSLKAPGSARKVDLQHPLWPEEAAP